ncbi:MAG TPA: V-type ATP synthase subunit A, partial [Kiritimatiellae bacterium]|nr:V-type ATP synthase subunit A [Kiritimatiellia bacterium]
MARNVGKIVGINGNLLTVEFELPVRQNEVAYAILDDLRLKSEVIRIRGRYAELQVFEDTTGLRVGDAVEFTGELLSVELGPGLLAQIYDGLQNPLPALAEECGFFLKRGTYLPALDRSRKWKFTPLASRGDMVRAGYALGRVPEGIFEHRIMVPFAMAGTYRVVQIRPEGEYAIEEEIAVLEDEKGKRRPVGMVQRWPVKRPVRCYAERLRPTDPLVT